MGSRASLLWSSKVDIWLHSRRNADEHRGMVYALPMRTVLLLVAAYTITLMLFTTAGILIGMWAHRPKRCDHKQPALVCATCVIERLEQLPTAPHGR